MDVVTTHARPPLVRVGLCCLRPRAVHIAGATLALVLSVHIHFGRLS